MIKRKNKEFHFSRLLTRYLLAMLVVLLSILLLWIFLSTSRSLSRQQELSINLNNRSGVFVLDTFQQKLKENLSAAADELQEIIETETYKNGSERITLLENRSFSNLDLLRFNSAEGEQVLNVDSPFFDFTGLDDIFAHNAETFIGDCHLLKAESKAASVWLVVSARRVIARDSGKVLGHIFGGVVVDNNLALARELLQRSNAETAVVKIGGSIVASSWPLDENLSAMVETSSNRITRSSLKTDNGSTPIIISSYGYDFFADTPLSIVYIIKDTLYKDIQRIFIGSGLFLLLTIGILFLLFYRFSNRQAQAAMNSLLNYTQEIVTQPEKAIFHPGRITEFNRIGDAVVEMVARLNEATGKLQDTKERMELVVKGADLGIWDWDVSTGRVVFNDRWAEMIGYSFSELEPVFETWRTRVHPDDIEDVERALYDHLNGQADYYFAEYRLKHKDGHWVWILAAGKVFAKDAEGNPARAVGIQMDISRSREAERVLADERERLSVTLSSIGDGVITTDTDGSIVLLNKVAEKLTGWKLEEARGEPFQEIFHIIDEKTSKRAPNPVLEVLSKGRTIELANNTVLIDRNGRHRHIADSAAPIRDSQFNIIGVVIVFRDVTNEQRMEEELLKVRKLESVGVLAGGIAHDFNNILAAIRGNLELVMLNIDKKSEKVGTLLSNAQKATDRAVELTQQLLTFSKGGEPVKESISLPSLIHDSADFVLHGSNVSCEYTFAEDLWQVDIDAGQISQVIQNIILNAKYSMPSGGVIRVKGRNIETLPEGILVKSDTEQVVAISIEDSGTGIPREIIDKIFDPYFTTRHEGSGLGLAVSYSIIRKHNGQLTAESHEGKGTVFTIYLPRGTVPSSAIKAGEHRREVNHRPCRILVMDDEEMILALVAEQLKNLGHSSVLTRDGLEALKVYRENHEKGDDFDVVIMDLTVRGGMGGKEASKFLLEYDKNAKIIVASGYSNDPVMARYQEYGFSAAIVKPYDLTSLSRAIDRVLG